jgi:hypothetical protein
VAQGETKRLWTKSLDRLIVVRRGEGCRLLVTAKCGVSALTLHSVMVCVIAAPMPLNSLFLFRFNDFPIRQYDGIKFFIRLGFIERDEPEPERINADLNVLDF